MANIVPISIPSKRLAASMTSSSLTLKLNNISGWDGENVVSGDLGTVMYAVLRNDQNTLMEIIEVDPTTIANAITTGMTINKRGLQFDGNKTTEVATNKLTWVKNETIVELGTNAPQLLNHFVRTIGSPTIDELLQYTTVLTPTDDKHLVTKKYVDDTAFGGTITFDELTPAATAGETVAAGDLVYLNVADGEWYKTDADTASTVDGVKLGIAQGAGTNGAAISGGVLTKGLDKNQTGMVAGQEQYASNTPGEISNSAGTISKKIGIARTATELYFDPYYASLLTSDQQGALAGAAATPSAANAFVTEGDIDDPNVFPNPQVVTFTSGGTWTKDAGLKYVIVEVIGSGGGGQGGSDDDVNGQGAGGGGGGYSRKLIAASALGATESVTVGTGGSAGSAGAGAGGNGNTSSFGAHCSATGGAGGASGDGGSGGVGSSGDINIEGQGGGSATQNSATSGGTVSGLGGSSVLGGGGKGIYGGGTGETGGLYGGGGGGGGGTGTSQSAGGAGAAGIVIVTEYYS